MSDLQYYLLSADTDKKPILEQQHNDIVTKGVVICATCELKRAPHLAFKCLYCGLWFCFTCAEKHFNKTVQEWREEKRQTLRIELEKLTTEQIKNRIRSRAKQALEDK